MTIYKLIKQDKFILLNEEEAKEVTFALLKTKSKFEIKEFTQNDKRN